MKAFFLRHRYILLVCLCVLGSVSFSVNAQETATGEERSYLGDQLLFEEQADLTGEIEQLTLPSVGEVLFKMVMFLAVVLALVYAFLFVMQKYYKEKDPAVMGSDSAIRVLSYQKLDQRKGVYLVDVLGKILVLGADYEGVRLITEIDDEKKVEEARRLTAVKPDLFTFNPFQNVLDSFSGQYSGGDKKGKRAERNTKGLAKKVSQLRNSLES